MGLLARPRTSGRHVPAHPARRDGGSACTSIGRPVGSSGSTKEGEGMARRLVPLLVIASFALLVFAFAGCGGDDDSSASDDTTLTETTTTEEDDRGRTTETEDTDTTDTTETSASDDFATSENCEEFAKIGAQISECAHGNRPTPTRSSRRSTSSQPPRRTTSRRTSRPSRITCRGSPTPWGRRPLIWSRRRIRRRWPSSQAIDATAADNGRGRTSANG